MKGMAQLVLMVMESKMRGQPTPKLSYSIIVGQTKLLQMCCRMLLQDPCSATRSPEMLQEVGRQGLEAKDDGMK